MRMYLAEAGATVENATRKAAAMETPAATTPFSICVSALARTWSFAAPRLPLYTTTTPLRTVSWTLEFTKKGLDCLPSHKSDAEKVRRWCLCCISMELEMIRSDSWSPSRTAGNFQNEEDNTNASVISISNDCEEQSRLWKLSRSRKLVIPFNSKSLKSFS